MGDRLLIRGLKILSLQGTTEYGIVLRQNRHEVSWNHFLWFQKTDNRDIVEV